MKQRIGVFVCHCGINIASTVQIERVVEAIKEYPGVVHAEDYEYMCSDPGQGMIRARIKEKNLTGVVVAACSPTLHELTFRNVTALSGLNPYRCEMANIREHCSWIHKDVDKATKKAIKIIKTIVEKVKLNEELTPLSVPITKRALVIGGGIAGIQSALDIANAGYQVILVEKSSSIGGHMAQLSETFPTLDCSQCILTPKMVEVAQHKNIKLYNYAEIDDVSGYVGNFKVKIRLKASYVDWSKCVGCGLCIEKCPTKVASEFEQGLAPRKAIYVPFPQAVPNKPVIDREHCRYFKTGKCRVCEKVCDLDAIKFDEEDDFVEEEVGAIVVATGYEVYGVQNIGEYGAGRYKDVVDGLQFERLLSASGPTNGEIRRPSDGQIPRRVAFVSCVGSRDPELHKPYCSKVCCMYLAKHAMLYKHRVPDGQPIIFYIDIRSDGKGYEEFVQRAQEEDHVTYIRGKVSKIYEDNGELVLLSADTLAGMPIELRCDLVVLGMAICPSSGVDELTKKLKIQTDANGFLTEAHPKLRPVESLTPGIFIAGCAHAPKDIPDTVAQASAASSKVLEMFGQKELSHDPMVAWVDEDLCSGCGVCISLCPYDARELEIKEGKRIATVKEILCEGCGSCIAGCPAGACQQRNLDDKQVIRMVETVLSRG
ncbi:disulfide reductase [candidate division WOR-3 bacterium JGI_Cruoil_03_44_89]|uniref:Disulfide reductase n=1 Tax=candidate division WOR-3 bacterium JGI_Cruoil_03_44_89 TaxID=1973748 RepID=A0A235BW52_UNCW3|nr:MAG: disulfide reductase [candidate division WOR-3 bacterium JGI_Cruoil_03_44_89]